MSSSLMHGAGSEPALVALSLPEEAKLESDACEMTKRRAASWYASNLRSRRERCALGICPRERACSPAVAERVVQHGLGLLLDGRGDTDKVEDGDVLGEGTCDTVRCAQLTNTKGGEDDTDTVRVDTGVAVGGVRRVELIAAYMR